MPDRLRLTATALPASVDSDARLIRGRVVPWNVPGNTSVGRVRFRPGSLSWPESLSRIKLTREHDRSTPRGYATEVTADDGGLTMAFHAGATPEGDVALLEAAESLRDGLSVDLDDVEIRGGWVESGRIVAVGQVAVPAFDDARVAASDTPEEEQPPQQEPAEESPAPETPPEPDPAPDPSPEDDVPENATVPAPLRAAHSPVREVQGIQSMSDLYAALVRDHAAGGLSAALQNITRTANAWVQATQYEGELWNGVDYTRTVIPLIGSGTLTGWKISGWRWQTPPVVATYAGDKTPVPSNAAVTEAVEIEAERLAGAHDIDRKFRDFGDTSFFESYYRAMTASYAALSDQAALQDLLAVATAVTAGAGDSAWTTILKMAFNVQKAKLTGATFALIGENVALSLAGTTTQDAPAFLDLIGGLPKITYSPMMDADQILVGIRQGATFFELPGVPIRVEAVDMVNGGIDAGVFGYFATNVHAPAAFAKTDLTPTP